MIQLSQAMPVALIEILGQHVELHDIIIVGLLIILEGVLSIDNALVLGILAKRLPKHQQRKALTYGLAGAFVFRFIAIALAAYLLHWRIIKLLGGAYLVYVSVKHFLFESNTQPANRAPIQVDGELSAHGTLSATSSSAGRYASFWTTVGAIELTDIAFAVDSILAAIALVGGPPPNHPPQMFHPKLWVVVAGGFIGVIAMRFAAVIFIRLLERFPRFEVAAYLLVLLIGGKLLADWGLNTPGHEPVADFHSPANPAFWIFWVLMVVFFCTGFLPKRGRPTT